MVIEFGQQCPTVRQIDDLAPQAIQELQAALTFADDDGLRDRISQIITSLYAVTALVDQIDKPQPTCQS